MQFSCFIVTFVFFILIEWTSSVFGQTFLRQCTCSEVDPCYQSMRSAVEPCARSCQSHLSPLGNAQKMVNCVVRRRNSIDNTWNCILDQSGDVCASSPQSSEMIENKSPEQLKFEAVQMLQTRYLGLMNKFKPILNVLERFLDCTAQCVTERSNNCFQALHCGIKLPPPIRALEIGAQCAKSNGFNARQATKLCNCITKYTKGRLNSLCALVGQQWG